MTYGSYFGYYYAPQFQYKGTNIYIRGLHPSTNDDDLVKIVSEFGNILSSKAIVDLKTGVCKGYGFAMYENDAQAEMAMQGLSMKGFVVSLAVATPRDNSVIKIIYTSMISMVNCKNWQIILLQMYMFQICQWKWFMMYNRFDLTLG